MSNHDDLLLKLFHVYMEIGCDGLDIKAICKDAYMAVDKMETLRFQIGQKEVVIARLYEQITDNVSEIVSLKQTIVGKNKKLLFRKKKIRKLKDALKG